MNTYMYHVSKVATSVVVLSSTFLFIFTINCRFHFHFWQCNYRSQFYLFIFGRCIQYSGRLHDHVFGRDFLSLLSGTIPGPSETPTEVLWSGRQRQPVAGRGARHQLHKHLPNQPHRIRASAPVRTISNRSCSDVRVSDGTRPEQHDHIRSVEGKYGNSFYLLGNLEKREKILPYVVGEYMARIVEQLMYQVVVCVCV